MRSLLRPTTIFALVLATAVAGCDDDDPTAPADTTAPLVLSISPSPDDTNVSIDDDVVVVFNEDMDASSATGQVTLSSGTVTALTWDDARTLRIEHTNWTEGTRVDVTLGTGLGDVAGNGLSAAYTSGFWTFTSQVVLLTTDPANGATDVGRNTPVTMVFSRRMNLSTLASATTVDDGTLERVPVEFTLEHAQDDEVVMRFASALPPSSTITVDISTAATAESGGNLAAAVQFGFTTGLTSDVTPPTLVSIVPANGSTISANTSAIVMTFSEAIDGGRFDPARLGAQFYLLLETAGIEPSWSADRTVLTVPMPTPLPAGLPIVVEFDAFYDLAGNASTSGIDYRVTVAGAEDPWPFVDGLTFTYFAFGGEVGSMQFDELYWRRWEQQSGNVFRWVRYRNDALDLDDGWEVFQRSAGEVRFLGFRERNDETFFDVTFSPSVLYQKLPFQVQSWSGSTQATMPEGNATIDYSVEVLGREDIPVWMMVGRLADGPTIEWIDCWKTELTYELSSGMDVLSSGVETIWYAPTIGVVRSVTIENDFEDDSVYQSEEHLVNLAYPD